MYKHNVGKSLWEVVNSKGAKEGGGQKLCVEGGGPVSPNPSHYEPNPAPQHFNPSSHRCAVSTSNEINVLDNQASETCQSWLSFD